VEGNAGDDTISFYSSPTAFDFHVSDHETEFFYPDFATTVPPGFKGASYARSGRELDFINDVVEAIVGTRKSDLFEISRGHGATVFGRGGADVFSLVNVPEAGCIVYGEAGNDVVTGGESAEYTVLGGSGDDLVIFEELGLPISFDGGPGIDAIDLSNGWRHLYDLGAYTSVEDAIRIGPDTGTDPSGDAPIGVTVMGTDGPDLISCQPTSDEVHDVTILGLGGDDTLVGSDGDPLDSTMGAESIDGGDGNDLIDGRGGDDTIVGGNGNDTITGGAGSDSIDGGAGNDLIHGQDTTKDTLDGGANTDTADRDSIDDVRNIENFI
jgi:Ca2+-binding RTX toxin-like protein